MKHWYEELFRDYADKYHNERFTAGIAGEVDFSEMLIIAEK